MIPESSAIDLEEARSFLRIVDAHHHFWNLDGDSHYPWLQDEYNKDFFLGDYNAIRRTFLPSDYQQATARWSIVGTVHCEAERSRHEQIAENEFLSALHDKDSRFPLAIVGHVDFLQPDVADVLAEHAANPLVRGIRSKPTIAPRRGAPLLDTRGTLRDPNWQDGLRRLIDFDLSWDLRVPYYHLTEAAEVVSRFNGLRVIINHCGLPLDRDPDSLEVWARGLRDLASLPNTTMKVSELGLYPNRWDPRSNAEIVRIVLEIFGFSRSMFASNLPVATLTAPTFDAVIESVLSGTRGATGDELRDLFGGTACREYRLDSALLEV